MSKQRLYLFDTTLRDGAQTNGVDFTLADKLAIAGMLDELGIDYVEGGYPGANPTDTELFGQTHKFNTTFTAFGMTRRPGRSASNDPGLAALLEAKADAICFVAKAWDYHVRVALETTEEENLASICDSVKAAKVKGREVLLDCEHFFDAIRPIRNMRLAVPRPPMTRAPAGWCCATPMAARCRTRSKRSSARSARRPGDHVGIHAHNDTEQAVANSFAAVRAGARQIQGTLNGLGERCGNANLVSIIPTLEVQAGIFRYVRHRRFRRRAEEAGAHLARARRAAQSQLQPARALCGRSAFATKAGIHASAIAKDPATYEHVAPENVGNKRKVGWCRSRPASPTFWPSSNASVLRPKRTIRASARLLEIVKERETRRLPPTRRPMPRSRMLARRTLGTVPNYFDVHPVRRQCRAAQQPPRASASRVTLAVVKVKVGDGSHDFGGGRQRPGQRARPCAA